MSEVKVTRSCLTLCSPMDYSPWNSPGQNTGVDSHSLLQGIFPTQGLNPGVPHCRQILCHLSHKRSPNQYNIFSYIYIYIQLYIHICISNSFLHRSLQDGEYSFLCYTIGPCFLSILYTVECKHVMCFCLKKSKQEDAI